MSRVIIAVVAVVSLAAPSVASTPQAWSQLDRRVGRACIAMAGLARPQLLAQKISFSDAIGVEARMIRGTDSRGRYKRLLCAYNRSTGRAEVTEAPGWNAGTTRP